MPVSLSSIGLNLAGDSIRETIGLLDTAAKLTMNTLYPKEFEVYMVNLELVDYNDNLIDYFTFPVNPDSIVKVQPLVKTIDRTFKSVIVTKTGQFVPQDISLKGTFGRQFKFVTRDKSFSFAAIGSKLIPTQNEFSSFYKSGYGCLKILQSICEESDKLDNGLARKLYFHNLALGESYLVEVLNFQESQAVNTNMLWNYDLRMKILSPIFDNNKWKTLANRLVTTSATSLANSVENSATELLSSLTKV